MTALLRSDAYRVLHSRWIWVAVAIVTFLTFAPALLMRWTGMGPVAFDSITGSALSLGGVEILVAVMAAIVCCDKTDLGFGRSVLSSLSPRARRAWFAEKCVFSVLLTAATALFALALGLLALPIAGVPILAPEPAWQVAAWFGCNWLVGSTYAVLTVLVAHLTRNETVTVGFAVLASTGILEGGIVIGIDALCYLAGGRFLDFSSAVAPWLPAQVVSAIGESAGALLAPDTVTGLAPAVRALIVCLPLAVAATAVDALLVSRRDVA
ncbi:hypothetical protein H6A07_03135 [Olsenella uli]|uniref:hypothetical protein n=1 Tax=Olsenella uli TaxID=133926 RepID=UPI00195776E5|nr:hypothetical protein [Olsenella uli]MBM6675737.1 hypothetical protein [Olsenella uli]